MTRYEYSCDPWGCRILEPDADGDVVLWEDVKDMYEALKGLLARHNDGSDEHLWAEWDTAKDALSKAEGKQS